MIKSIMAWDPAAVFWWLVTVLAFGLFVIVAFPQRHLPDPYVPIALNASGTIEGGEGIVRGIAWHQVGTNHDEQKWLSFIVLVENTGSEDMELGKVELFLKDAAGNTDVGGPHRFGGTHRMIIKAGEARSVWAGGISLAQDGNTQDDWVDAEIIIHAYPLPEMGECEVNRIADFTIYKTEKDQKGRLSIWGYVDASEYSYLPQVELSFFDKDGTFIGSGYILSTFRVGLLVLPFSPLREPLTNYGEAHELLFGYFVNEEIENFRVDAIVDDPVIECD